MEAAPQSLCVPDSGKAPHWLFCTSRSIKSPKLPFRLSLTPETRHRSYAQLYSNGIIEAVASTIIAESSGSPIISNIDDQLIVEIRRKLSDLAGIGIEPPYAVLVSLIGVKGARFNFARGANTAWYDSLGDPLDRDQFHFGEVIVETIPADPEEGAEALRLILD
jgi:hypothetical protein